MVNLAAMVWRRLLRKRWVLALVFGLSLVYFLTSTFKQVSAAPGCPGEGTCLCSRAARGSGALCFRFLTYAGYFAGYFIETSNKLCDGSLFVFYR